MLFFREESEYGPEEFSPYGVDYSYHKGGLDILGLIGMAGGSKQKRELNGKCNVPFSIN